MGSLVFLCLLGDLCFFTFVPGRTFFFALFEDLWYLYLHYGKSLLIADI